MPFCVSGKAVARLLFTSALIQITDVMIAVEEEEGGVTMDAAVEAIVHVLCGGFSRDGHGALKFTPDKVLRRAPPRAKAARSKLT